MPTLNIMMQQMTADLLRCITPIFLSDSNAPNNASAYEPNRTPIEGDMKTLSCYIGWRSNTAIRQ